METNQHYISDDLLTAYLLGEADEAVQKEVEAWIAASPDNEKQFNDFKAILDESRQFAEDRKVSANDAWTRLVHRVDEDLRAEVGAKGSIIPFYQKAWVRIAAIFVLFAGIGGLMLMNNGGQSMMTAAAGDKTITQTLPDGSVVVLNKNSTLSYPAHFDGNKRSVTLTGEAFFSITPNKSKPFVIDANQTSVTVVGTTFNVKTSPERTEVIVETGIVQVATKDKLVRLLPHQKATAAGDELQAEKNTDELYTYYRTGEFICNATPLHELTEVLNEAYGVSITIADNQTGEMPITATFKNEPLDKILKVISETLNVSVEQKGRDIEIRPMVR